MSDHDDIRQVMAAYCRLCDDGQFDEFAELFTEDAEFTVLGETHKGREQIKVWMAGAQPPELRGKHMISEPGIELELDLADDAGDGHARAANCRTDYAFIGKTKGGGLELTSAGRYVDRMERSPDDGRWRFARREIVFLVDPLGG
jgi:3-phenylpropionate/cinnamic acid dioxygenase small subunit